MLPTLSVPDRHRQAIEELVALSPSDLEKVVAAIDQANADVEQTRLALRAVLTHAELAVDALIAMTATRIANELPVDQVALMVLESLGVGTGTVEPLEQLLQNAYVVQMAKRVDLSTAYERGLHSFRILTDIRPIFGDNADGEVTAAFVAHSLQIVYVQDGRYKELYISVEGEDLERISTQVDRARKKQLSTTKLLQKAGIQVFNKDSDEG